MVGETTSKEGNKALETTVGELYNNNGNTVTEEQKANVVVEKSIEQQAQEAYSQHLNQAGWIKGFGIDAFKRKEFFDKFYASRGVVKDKKQIEDEPKTAVGRAFNWFDAKYHRVILFNIAATALILGALYVIGKPILENAEAKNKARLDQKIEQYIKMDRHKVKARPPYSMFNECIEQNKNWGAWERDEEKEAYRAAHKIINGLKNDFVPKGWTDSPCNRWNYEHVSERVPAPKRVEEIKSNSEYSK